MVVAGAFCIDYGVDFTHTNMVTYVNPDIGGAALMVIGFALIALGLVTMLTHFAGRKA